MVFSSAPYFVFFFLYFACLQFLKSNYRLHFALAGSLIFYGWRNPIMVWVPGVICLLAFWGILCVIKTEGIVCKRNRLWALISILLIPLIYFKYNHFIFNEIIAPIAGYLTIDLRTALPLGISFMTFTIISYVVDVYRKKFTPDRPFLQIFTYLLFFPHLIAGPILRPSELIPQLMRNKARKLSSIGFGITLFTVGLVKKIVFADSMADAVDPIFSNPTGHNLMTYWIAMVGYTMQIYCDFSGYTDMALGSAIILGIRLPMNFDSPYIACNLQDFWRRWHMTLSRWLRDYIYIPLGGNRCSKSRYAGNIILTMFLCGLWHGPNWTFLLWGLLHGMALMILGLLKYSTSATRILEKIPSLFKWLLTFSFIVITWVIFRAPDLGTVKIIITGAFTGKVVFASNFFTTNAYFLTLLGVFAIFHRFDSLRNIRFAFRHMNRIVLGVLIITSWAISVAMNAASSADFIYFDF
jgi:alginate O-acetyltransferase complex protein AlgI